MLQHDSRDLRLLFNEGEHFRVFQAIFYLFDLTADRQPQYRSEHVPIIEEEIDFWCGSWVLRSGKANVGQAMATASKPINQSDRYLVIESIAQVMKMGNRRFLSESQRQVSQKRLELNESVLRPTQHIHSTQNEQESFVVIFHLI